MLPVIVLVWKKRESELVTSSVRYVHPQLNPPLAQIIIRARNILCKVDTALGEFPFSFIVLTIVVTWLHKFIYSIA